MNVFLILNFMNMEEIHANYFEAIKILFGLIAGFFAYRQYKKGKEIKAGELFISMEKDFVKHLPILLKIEYDNQYINLILPAIKASMEGEATDEQNIIILQIEEMLRHFRICSYINALKIDNDLVGLKSYEYYLKILINKDAEKERLELKKYIEKYWKGVFNWAKEAS